MPLQLSPDAGEVRAVDSRRPVGVAFPRLPRPRAREETGAGAEQRRYVRAFAAPMVPVAVVAALSLVVASYAAG